MLSGEGCGKVRGTVHGCHTPPHKEMSGRRRQGNVKGCGVTADDALRSYPPPSLFYCSPAPVIQSLPGARSGASLPAVTGIATPPHTFITLDYLGYIHSAAFSAHSERRRVLYSGCVCTRFFKRERERRKERKRESESAGSVVVVCLQVPREPRGVTLLPITLLRPHFRGASRPPAPEPPRCTAHVITQGDNQ